LKKGSESVELKRYFKTAESYNNNIQGILELRLQQVKAGNTDLKKRVAKVVRDFGHDPIDAIGSVRLVIRAALDFIWDKELDTPNRIPESWLGQKNYTIDNLDGFPQGDDGRQIGLLEAAIGGKDGKKPIVARQLQRSTFVLLQHAYTTGNLGQHLENAKISEAYAASICFSCIELYDALIADYSNN
jgi:hypothetical protein